jgi:phage tail P2-like protein
MTGVMVINSNHSLLPPNSSEIERSLETVSLRTTALPVDIRLLTNHDTCPVEFLPWLAWTLSVDNWQPYWPEAVKREQIKNSLAIHTKKGTVQSVRRAVDVFGSALALKEWWQSEPKGEPHTFTLTLAVGASVPNTAQYQQDILNAVNRTKPVRSHFTLTAGLEAKANMGVIGVARSTLYRRLSLTEA